MKKIYFTLLIVFGIASITSSQNNKLKLTLDEAIEIASKQSIEAFRIENMYLASYWYYRNFKAELLPGLLLSGNPINFNRYREKEYNFNTNQDEYRFREYLTSGLDMYLNQKVTLTGGTVFLRSNFGMVRNLGDNKLTSYTATPISIGYSQDLNGYNQLKWKSMIEPLRYEKAKKELIQAREEISRKATDIFFQLINEQIQLKIAETNYANADTLYKIGKGRFQVGTVTQNDLLKLELDFLNNEQSVINAKLNVARAQKVLISFLALDKNSEIECIVPLDIPQLKIEPEKAIALALENNPEIIGHQQRKLEEDQKVASAKSETGINTSLYAQYGLNQASEKISDVYHNPDKSQLFNIGVRIPILDWGRKKGSYLMAKSDREVALAEIQQERIDFEQELYQDVMEFNLKADKVRNTAKADTVAKMGYEITFQRFMIGNAKVIDLNMASSDQDAARRAYINALYDYWRSLYSIRIKTLYNFENQETLSAEYDKLLEN